MNRDKKNHDAEIDLVTPIGIAKWTVGRFVAWLGLNTSQPETPPPNPMAQPLTSRWISGQDQDPLDPSRTLHMPETPPTKRTVPHIQMERGPVGAQGHHNVKKLPRSR